MALPFRVDRVQLRPSRKLANGSLRVDGVLTRTGVFKYRQADGTIRREYRPAEEVFNADSMESFSMVPVTDDHPPVAITSENAKEYSVGAVGESVRRDGNLMVAAMVVFDASAVDKIEGGKHALSNGYAVEIDETSGISPDGEPYDAIQRKIRGNHVALVDDARAGDVARVRMDGVAVMIETGSAEPQKRNDSSMNEEQLKAKIAELIVEKAELTGNLEAATKRADTAEADRDAEKARADKAEKARDDAADGESGRIRARVELENRSSTVLGDDFKTDGKDGEPKSNRELQIEVIEKIDGEFESKEKSDDYIQARFDRACEVEKKSGDALSQTREGAEDASRNDNRNREEKARDEMIERNSKATEGSKK